MPEALTDKEMLLINKRHIALRGSLALKYPRRDAACKATCGKLDNPSDRSTGGNHQCFLNPHPDSEPHEFSSECVRSRAEAA